MKVLVITNLYPPEFLGGYELGCSQMVEELAALGHEVRVVTSVSAPGSDTREGNVDRILELPPIYNPDRMQAVSPALQEYFHLLACTVNPANARALGDVMHDFEPDVAYLWNLVGIGGLGVLALLAHQGVPWVWHIMDLIPRQVCQFGTTGPEVARELDRVFPGRYIMCSHHVLGEIREGGVELGENIRLLPNWVHGPSPEARTEFYVGGKLRILNVSGALSESKGTHILIEAAAHLHDGGFGNFQIDIYGAEEDSRFRAMLHRHRVEGTVRFMGPRHHDQILALYGDYDLFAFPTWAREPFAFVALEAAAAGCVPLFSEECGNAEWMIGGVDCLKAARSPVGFAERIAQVLDGQIDLGALGRRAQAVVWRDFHISAVAREAERILGEAAADRRKPRGSRGEFFTLARFAEGLIQALLHEARTA